MQEWLIWSCQCLCYCLSSTNLYASILAIAWVWFSQASWSFGIFSTRLHCFCPTSLTFCCSQKTWLVGARCPWIADWLQPSAPCNLESRKRGQKDGDDVFKNRLKNTSTFEMVPLTAALYSSAYILWDYEEYNQASPQVHQTPHL